MATKRKKNYVLIFDYYADPELNHETVEDNLDYFLSTRINGRAHKLGNCVMVGNPDDALIIKLRFAQHVVEIEGG
jgi:hypothetical protein